MLSTVKSMFHRSFSISSSLSKRVALIGACGSIGKPLSLLLKQSELIKELALHDLEKAAAHAEDINSMDTPSKTVGRDGADGLRSTLNGMDVVILAAGVPRKPGMARDDLFNVNANVVKDVAEACSKYCPSAFLLIITNPINSLVPIAAEVLKIRKTFNPKKLFGITTLDCVRSSTFVAQLKGLDPATVHIPCVGGHSGDTIVPLLSQTKPSLTFTDEEVEALTKRVQNAGTEVVEAKAGAGSAALSMAYAAYRFTTSILKGLNGEESIECSYVMSSVTDASFFAAPLVLGPTGIARNWGLPNNLTPYEMSLIKKAIPILQANIKKGEEFIIKPEQLKEKSHSK